jgi:hypothetical protein
MVDSARKGGNSISVADAWATGARHVSRELVIIKARVRYRACGRDRL